jgi:hypothetical protein
LEAWGSADLPLSEPVAPVPNLAMTGTVTASYTSPHDDPAEAVDGRTAFTRYSRNRWTAYGSPNRSDWLMVAWTEPQHVERVDIYLWGDERGVGAPADLHIEVLDGASWVRVPEVERRPAVPATWARNTVVIEPMEASRLRVVFDHALPLFAGVTEVEIWGAR